MNIVEINKKIKSSEYDFLRTDENLGDNIILLGLGGSYAYGTNNEDSDLDIRGIATNTKRNIFIRKDFEQVVDIQTDTTIYSLEKIVKLLCECNPNTIEILGLKPEHYLYKSSLGEELLKNKHIFLSKRAINSFGGYANSQLRRMENKSARVISQTKMEENVLKSIQHADIDFRRKYFDLPEDSIKLYIGKAIHEDLDSEIFMDVTLKHYPLRDYCGMWSEMNNIVKAYMKFGKRNRSAIGRNRLAKHMMHLIRLYLMCFDILEKGEIITYRENEHDFLMDIRAGKYLNEKDEPVPKFYEIVDEMENKLVLLSKKTELPEKVDMNKVNNFLEQVNGNIVYKDM